MTRERSWLILSICHISHCEAVAGACALMHSHPPHVAFARRRGRFPRDVHASGPGRTVSSTPPVALPVGPASTPGFEPTGAAGAAGRAAADPVSIGCGRHSGGLGGAERGGP